MATANPLTGGIQYTTETAYFARISACIIGPCTCMLRDLLSQHVQPVHLRTLVSQQNVKLNYEQRKQLYTGAIPDYNNFDVTFVYLLLRTNGICTPGITPPTNGWGKPPNSQFQIETGDDIERIRLLKNEVCSHIKKPELTNQEFQDHILTIKDVSGRMDVLLGNGGKYTKEIEEKMIEPLDKETEALYIEQINYFIEDCTRSVKVDQLEAKLEEKIESTIASKFSALYSDMKSVITDQFKAVLQSFGLVPSTTADSADENLNENEDVGCEQKFQDACKEGSLDLVMSLLKANPTLIKVLTDSNRTALHLVGEGSGSVQVANYLITKGVDIQVNDSKSQCTVFHTACENGHLELVKFLHNKYPTMITLANKYKQTPLHCVAFGTGSVDVADYLINEGVDVHAIDDVNSNTVFHIACQNARLDLVKFLHHKYPTMITLTNKYKHTPLHYVAFGTGSVDVADYLITEGVDVHAITNVNSNTVFHIACMRAHLDLLKLLHNKYPTMITLTNKSKQTPLHCVAFGTGSVDAADYLINKGVDVHANENANGDTVFHDACYKGHLDLVKFLHHKYPSMITLTNKYKQTPLHYVAFGTGSVDVTDYLINEDVDLHAVDVDGGTVFHTACQKGHLELVKFFHDKYPTMITLVNKYKHTPLHYVAFGTGSVDVADYLINEGVDVHAIDDVNGKTVFHTACMRGHLDIVKFLHHKYPTMITLTNKYKQTPLLCVAFGTGSVDVADYLINKGVDVHATDSKNGNTVFHEACYKGNLDLVKFLHHKYPTMITVTNKYKQTPLHNVGLGTGSVDVADYLINKGADVHATDSTNGDTVFHTACKRGHLDLVKFLHHKYPTMITLTNKYKHTPLCCITFGTGSVDVADYLINKGADVHATDSTNGNTVFHEACYKGHLDLVKFLHHKYPTMITLTNKYKHTPLCCIAHGTGSVDVADYLINKGVDVHAKENANGETVFHIACNKGHLDLVKFLHHKYHTMITLTNKYKHTPLHYVAFGTGSVDVADYLLTEGVDVHAIESVYGDTVFHDACYKGNLDLVKYIHHKHPIMIKLTNKYKRTPLHYVAHGTGSVDVADYLINKGVDVHAKENANGETVFHIACYKGHLDLVKFLHHKYPTMITLTNKYKHTPLCCIAIGTGSVDVADYLINKGVDVHAKENANGETVFHIACKKGHLDLVKFLHHKYPTMITLTNKYKRTPLHYVAHGTGSVDVADYLINEGVDVQSKACNGNTAVHTACQKQHTDLTKFLYHKDHTVIESTNKRNRTPLYYVSKSKTTTEIAEFFSNEGIDLHQTTGKCFPFR